MEYTIQELKPYLYGLPWFGQEDFALQRFPTSAIPNLPLSLQELIHHPAGGMLHFQTRSEMIAIETFRPKDPIRDRF